MVAGKKSQNRSDEESSSVSA